MKHMTSAHAATVLRNALKTGVRNDRERPVSLSIALTKACIAATDNRVSDIVTHKSARILEFISRNERICIYFDDNVRSAFTEGAAALERISEIQGENQV